MPKKKKKRKIIPNANEPQPEKHTHTKVKAQDEAKRAQPSPFQILMFALETIKMKKPSTNQNLVFAEWPTLKSKSI